MKALKFLVSFIFWVMLCSCAHNQEITLEKIRALNKPLVTYSSVGCFHNLSYEITISENKLSVIETGNGYADDGSINTSKTYIGSIELDQEKVNGLNKMFQALSEPSKGWCTTTEKIEISYLSNSGVRDAIELYDEDCSTSRVDGVYTFYKAIYEIKNNR